MGREAFWSGGESGQEACQGREIGLSFRPYTEVLFLHQLAVAVFWPTRYHGRYFVALVVLEPWAV